MSVVRNIKRILLIIYYTFIMYFVTHLVVFFLVPFWFVCTWSSRDLIYKFKMRFGKLLLAMVNKRITISGQDNIQKEKIYLIVANYPSFYTGFILMSIFPQASILVHDFMSKIPLISTMFRRNGFIFAQRKNYQKTKQTLKTAIDETKGGSIIVLPEGKRTPDGQLHTFKKGFAYIARQTTLDILPVTLNGFYKLKPVNRHYMDPNTELEVIIHDPVSYSTIEPLSKEQIIMKIRSIVADSYKP